MQVCTKCTDDFIALQVLHLHMMVRNSCLQSLTLALTWLLEVSINPYVPKGKGKVNRAPQESIGGAHLPLPGLEPVGGEPLMSVTRGQCNARPTVTC